MRKPLFAGLAVMLLVACGTTNPVITANPDQTNSMSGTTGSSPATDRLPPKSTDTLSAPLPRDSTTK